jgi:hypothetical protein
LRHEIDCRLTEELAPVIEDPSNRPRLRFALDASDLALEEGCKV